MEFGRSFVPEYAHSSANTETHFMIIRERAGLPLAAEEGNRCHAIVGRGAMAVHRKGCLLAYRGGNADDQASAFLGERGAGFGSGYMRPHRNWSSSLRTWGGKRIESARIKIPAFRVTVVLVVVDFLLFATVRSRRRMQCGSWKYVAGVGAADGNIQHYGDWVLTKIQMLVHKPLLNP